MADNNTTGSIFPKQRDLVEGRLDDQLTEKDDLNLQMLRGTGISFSGNIIGKVINFAFNFFFARFFGAANYGLFTLGDSVLNIAKSLSTLGIDRSGLLKLVALNEGKGDFSRLKGAVLSALRISLLSSIMFGLVMRGIAPTLSSAIFSKPALQQILLIQALSLPFHVLLIMVAAVTQARRQMKLNAFLLSIVLPGTNLIGLLIAFIFGFDLKGLVLSIAAMMALSGIASFLVLRKSVLNPLFEYPPISEHRELLRISLPVLLVFLSEIVYTQADKLFLGAYVSSANLGIYNVAYRQVWTLQLVFLSLGIFPSIAADLFSQGKLDQLRELYTNIIRWVFSIILPLFLFFLLFPKELMGIFGKEYIPGWPVLIILAFFPLVSGLTALTPYILRMTGHQREESLGAVMSLIFNLIINYLLIRSYGLVGAASGIVLTILLRQGINVILIKTKVGIFPYDRRLLVPLLIGLLDAGIIYAIRLSGIYTSSWTSILIEAAAFFLVYVGAGAIFFPEEDKDLLAISFRKATQKFSPRNKL